MGYTPTLIFRADDLRKYKSELESNQYNGGETGDEGLNVYQYLLSELKYTYDIYGIDSCWCCPEFSSFNLAVRKQLNEWGIRYYLSN